MYVYVHRFAYISVAVQIYYLNKKNSNKSITQRTQNFTYLLFSSVSNANFIFNINSITEYIYIFSLIENKSNVFALLLLQDKFLFLVIFSMVQTLLFSASQLRTFHLAAGRLKKRRKKNKTKTKFVITHCVCDFICHSVMFSYVLCALYVQWHLVLGKVGNEGLRRHAWSYVLAASERERELMNVNRQKCMAFGRIAWEKARQQDVE